MRFKRFKFLDYHPETWERVRKKDPCQVVPEAEAGQRLAWSKWDREAKVLAVIAATLLLMDVLLWGQALLPSLSR